MKANVKIILIMMMASFFVSCACKICTKEGENDVKVCRNNYETEDDYNEALGFYQLEGYSCN